MVQWKTKNGSFIDIETMDDKHLHNTIKMIERKAKENGLRLLLNNLSKKERKVYLRNRKLKRIMEEPDFDIKWEKYVSDTYWDLVYEKRKRENILF